MNYEAFFSGEIDRLKADGNYRVFADLERKRADLDQHIGEFRDVEAQVSAELRQRGLEPESD